MSKKILILSAAVGAGHLRAAEAIEKEFKRRHPAAEVVNIDVLNYTNPLFRRLYGKAYLDMVNRMPEVLGWMYDSFDKPWENERRRLALDRLNTQPLIKFLKNYQPDLAVCTHFLPAEIISWLKAKGKINFPQAIVVTDFDGLLLGWFWFSEAQTSASLLGMTLVVVGVVLSVVYSKRQKDIEKLEATAG